MKYKLLAASILATMSTSALSATYQLTELSVLADTKHNYVKDVSESGHIIGLSNGLYNLPIDVSYIDFTDSAIERAYEQQEDYFELIDKQITFTLDDIENNNAAATNPDAHSFMLSFLTAQATNPDYQKLANIVGYNILNGEAQEQVLFDIASVDYDGLTRSVSNFYNAVAEDGIAVGWGSAPYEKTVFTPDGETEEETRFVRDFISRGIIVSPDGLSVPLVPEFDEYGGISSASDIVKTNSGYTVVGQVSTGIPADRQENIDDSCDGEDQPVSVCIEGLQRSTSSRLFDTRAVRWSLDSNLNITNTELLGLGLTPEEDDDFAFISNALAVNSNGTVAGFSDVRDHDSSSTIRSLPVYYKDGKVVEMLDQEDDWTAGKSLAINENDVIVGYGIRRIEGSDRLKFFYHDIASNSTVFPTDYFNSSASIANDINDNGYIVGEGETDVFNVGSRRREGFLYKIGEDAITNINDLLPCYEADGETRYKYVVSEAKVINNKNEIFGVATKTVEKTDTLGGVVRDINGEIEYESIAVPVKLTPIDGSIESCSDPETDTYERQSASFPWYTLLLLPLVGLRRAFRK
ncbi:MULTISPECIES: DUF3466 family protein [Pseudoalteromonas]|uniref:DUF3466 family protein n=1 Tax=Pseudoalteromonas haloplanktis TaxID=228 RepID=A0ABU1BA63_PSEHA|nr:MULTISPECIES: DUF3466 family protein [Pseudoalteromonas]MCF6142817.1 hypothetical protein [Pseudoalteromonas mariniglutinosa NCIMB 1770]MDQ9090804.1 DUF3466 family protein [Pseudoalteromonas haloplanktis]TMN70839.1 DUF3466 domain-containing protein [Pseudoalteromonas sp. S1727]BDF94435.1 hypothetical protein KAN5_12730 [Pseudoalteromonas sp. KAN5]